MENITEILNELQSLSPTLAGLQGLNVYTVPNGYFDVFRLSDGNMSYTTGASNSAYRCVR